jgi:hypothetical protein
MSVSQMPVLLCWYRLPVVLGASAAIRVGESARCTEGRYCGSGLIAQAAMCVDRASVPTALIPATSCGSMHIKVKAWMALEETRCPFGYEEE